MVGAGEMKIAILGAGNMGCAIARGLLAAGVPAAEMVVSRRSAGVPEVLSGTGIAVVQDNQLAVADATIIIVAVKPWLVTDVLQELTLPEGAVVISVAAGVTLVELQLDFPGVKFVRAMPNTAVALREGVTALAAEDVAELTVARELFEKLGLVVEVPENKFAAMTALSGCGIAHALRFLRAGQLAAIEMGLSATEGAAIFAQVMKGAAAVASQAGAHPEAEIDRVCTPGGLTITGVNALEAKGFTAAVIEGLLASYRRAD